MELNAKYRTLVIGSRTFYFRGTLIRATRSSCEGQTMLEEMRMARGLLLWLLGVPIPIIILLWLFFGR